MKITKLTGYSLPFEFDSQDRVVSLDEIESKYTGKVFPVEKYSFRVPSRKTGEISLSGADEDCNYVIVESDMIKGTSKTGWWLKDATSVEGKDSSAKRFDVEIDVIATFGKKYLAQLKNKPVPFVRAHINRFKKDGAEYKINDNLFGIAASDFQVDTHIGQDIRFIPLAQPLGYKTDNAPHNIQVKAGTNKISMGQVDNRVKIGDQYWYIYASIQTSSEYHLEIQLGQGETLSDQIKADNFKSATAMFSDTQNVPGFRTVAAGMSQTHLIAPVSMAYSATSRSAGFASAMNAKSAFLNMPEGTINNIFASPVQITPGQDEGEYILANEATRTLLIAGNKTWRGPDTDAFEGWAPLYYNADGTVKSDQDYVKYAQSKPIYAFAFRNDVGNVISFDSIDFDGDLRLSALGYTPQQALDSMQNYLIDVFSYHEKITDSQILYKGNRSVELKTSTYSLVKEGGNHNLKVSPMPSEFGLDLLIRYGTNEFTKLESQTKLTSVTNAMANYLTTSSAQLDISRRQADYNVQSARYAQAGNASGFTKWLNPFNWGQSIAGTQSAYVDVKQAQLERAKIEAQIQDMRNVAGSQSFGSMNDQNLFDDMETEAIFTHRIARPNNKILYSIYSYNDKFGYNLGGIFTPDTTLVDDEYWWEVRKRYNYLELEDTLIITKAESDIPYDYLLMINAALKRGVRLWNLRDQDYAPINGTSNTDKNVVVPTP